MIGGQNIIALMSSLRQYVLQDLLEVVFEQMDLARGNVIIIHVNRNAVQCSDTALPIAKTLSGIKDICSRALRHREHIITHNRQGYILR
jgi:hypothetical protein